MTWVLPLNFPEHLINLVLDISNVLTHENMDKCCETGDWRHLLVAQMHYVKDFLKITVIILRMVNWMVATAEQYSCSYTLQVEMGEWMLIWPLWWYTLP